MHDNRTHPLLQQVPLTVSPFVNLPTATTLPYRYKPMPSTLPPSTAGIPSTVAPPTTTTSTENPDARGSGAGAAAAAANNNNNNNKPRYVVSASGHTAHPDEILASCRALHAHVAQLQAQAERDLAGLTERIRARELAEKRRVAPGWLDSEARLLEPERAAGGGGGDGARTPSGVGGGLGVEMGVGIGGGGGGGQPELLLQQPLQGFGGSGGMGYGEGYGNGYGHGPGGASEMAVPDEGEELDRAFGSLQMGRS
ncbi:hypothetical protein C8A00DRAFT_34832 [Chaetomidium leptoderma]|uniref:Uncharacterized protein n=1 Tax=Chaetomidium leptoderma TaxID=669021 RepID=A0AAN6VLL4_9PEZI|nr:hypothetical protein C8A00DRAFT_34832 [Chaetomidium leptoderma]